MKRAELWKIGGWCLVGLCMVFGSLVCTKEDKGSGPGDTETPPSVTIDLPATSDTVTISRDSTTFTVSGSVTNPDGISVASLTLNGVEYIDSLDAAGDFSITFSIAAETTMVVVGVQATGISATLYDTLWVIKETVVANAGMAKISGVLYTESASGLSKWLGKSMVGTNAQGLTRTVTAIPASGADIMFYDANSVATSSDTSVETDANGAWSVELAPGTYFVFAVYFDRENFEIVTSALPNVEAVQNEETETDTATAIADDVSPMVLTFCDAITADSSGLFVASNVPRGLPIVISFSEPITRQTAGEATTGIVLGPVDPTDPELALTDTVSVEKLWSPSGRELRLVPSAALTVGTTYKVIVPGSVKDLALNALDQAYAGVFTVIAASSLPLFDVVGTSPRTGDTIPMGFPLEIIFSRPVDVLSLNANYSLACADTSVPGVKGFFDARGNSAKFTATSGWTQGQEYTLTISAKVKDLLGDSLGSAGDTSVSFVIRPPDQFQQQGGDEAEVAAWAERTMGAFIAGDIESFAQSFDARFEAIDIWVENGDTVEQRLQRDVFLEQRRADIAEVDALSKYGFLAPVWYYISAGGRPYSCWKLSRGTAAVYFEDMGPNGGMSQVPRVFTMDSVDITDSVQYVDRGLIYQGDTLVFGVDMSVAFVGTGTRDNDPRVFGKLLNEQTDVVTQAILMDIRQSFIMKDVSILSAAESAVVVMEVVQERTFRDGKYPYPIDPANPPPATEKNVMAVQMTVVKGTAGWQAVQLVSRQLWSGDKAEFKQTDVTQDAFVVQNVAGTGSIDLVAPAQKATGVKAPVVLRWTRAAGVGGYLVAIADELSGGTSGLLMFASDTTVEIGADGQVTGATVLSINPATLSVPLPRFSSRLSSLTVADSAVYVWKVVGVPDSTAGTIGSGGLRVVADSDFGKQRGVGVFTLLSEMPDITIQQIAPGPQGPVDNMFSDRDNDYFPDWMEKAFACNPDDPGDYPNYVLDSDLDGWADFLEEKSGSDPLDSTSKPTDTTPANGIPDWFETNRPDWRPNLSMDDDRDGYPNEIEFVYGSDPWRADSKPQRIIRPSVPAGTYWGTVEFTGATTRTRIALTISSDTSVTIDSTGIQGLARVGYPLPKKLAFMGGEWVFFIPLSTGPNAGKMLKFRFRTETGMIQGPIDLADTVGWGGPCVGNFRASTDPNADLNNVQNPVGPGTGPTTQTGQVNLGPPPAQNLVRPDSARDLAMIMVADTVNGWAQVTIIFDGTDTMRSDRCFWQPGQNPSLRFGGNGGGWVINLDGNLHLQRDTLVMVGPMWCDSAGMKYPMQYTLLLPRYGSARNPQGTWTGWYYYQDVPSAPQNQGPLPYIGQESGIVSAMTASGRKAVLLAGTGIDSSAILDILSYQKSPSGMWSARATDGTDTADYNILEKSMGNMSEIMVAQVNGEPVIVLGGANSGPGPVGPMLYQGDSTSIVAALTASNNLVQVDGPSGPVPDTVDPASLRQQPDGKGGRMWVVTDANDPNKVYAISADPMNPQNVAIGNQNTVIVVETGGQQPGGSPVLYQGDSASIATALTSAGNRVWVTSQTGQQFEATVNGATLRSQPDGKGGTMWVVEDQAAAGKLYGILGDPQNPQSVARDPQNRVMVGEMTGGTPPQAMPFGGDSATVVAALSAAANQVMVENPGGSPVSATVNPATLTSALDPQNNRIWLVGDATVQTKMYVIMADPMDAARVATDMSGKVFVSPAPSGPPI